ncbi:LuxR family transcriptional regulator [Mesorhizobium sp. M8A.F.Ca.ET.202.01.1.1]|nr:LuxR family transcriptional regulator [Mesorhizobium sp. M8A.F.Ca.ET.197.01.1.1]TGR35111.1 LuxR family transcriptional regulator [Mesorhizobium sp. M8A.F.Ca.ET.202.01.1.1]TGR58944.1 LuxR family transcriptional regulator [bacterium M00.F.Ca.ET.199.01.1.1]TGR59659.1 LuxR family transcriptional regulator [Mesorhizobium sp. M8A.F.Ca.ET.198.01.1.1]TGU41167.1 LuxR family transcriptional regulator [bacterium M00.F.Ca.ET.156.01.1.1]TGV90590.1 LuxR family transcriptional regulator [Mesorhizobium sp.
MQSNFSLDRLERWSGGVAAAALAATPEDLSARFSAAAGVLLGSDRVYVGFYRRDITSLTIDDAGPDRWNRDYDARIYRQDPFFQRFASTRQDFLLPLSALSHGDFQRTPYYREFYGPSGSFDEITGVFNLDGLTAGYVTFLRRNGAPRFGEHDLAVAGAASSATKLILQRLLHLCRLRDKGSALEAAGSQLSARQRQIARLLIEGGSAKTIARNLSISPGTVRNHIKQVYRKLGVHSQVELLAAGWEAPRT